MIVHLLIITITLLYCSISSNNKKNGLMVLCIILYIVIGFRDYSVGVDTMHYIEEYRQTKLGSIDDLLMNFEPGRTLFFVFCKWVGLNSRFFMLLIAAIIVIPLYSINKLCCIWPCFTIFLYITIGLYSINMTAIRQSIAIALVMYGLYIAFLQNKTVNKVFVISVFILLACSIHFTASFCLIMIPLLFVKNVSRRLIILLLPIPVVLIYTGSLMIDYLSVFSNIPKYAHYFNSEQTKEVNVVSYFLIPYCIFLFSTWLLLRRKTQSNRESYERKSVYFPYLCTLIYSSISALSLSFPIIARTHFYYNFYALIFISNMLYEQRKRSVLMKLCVCGVLVLCFLYFVISVPNGTLKVDNYSFSLE